MIPWRKLFRVFSSRTEDASQQPSNPVPKISTEEIRNFLPTFLSQGSETAFLEELTHFLKQSENQTFFTEALSDQNFILQGDGLEGLLIIKLPDTAVKHGAGIVLSNSCDIIPSNERLFEATLCYAPIFSLPAYLEALRSHFPPDRVASHERDIRRQAITQIFFLPKGGKLANDGLVFLDRIISVANVNIDRDTVSDRRLFILSDFGAWLFTLKLSIHFCRIRDKVDRVAGVVLS